MATGEMFTDLLGQCNIEPTSMKFLHARMLEEERRYREALVIYKPVLEKRKQEFGDLHLETVKTKYRMARLLYLLNEYEEALPMFEDVYSRMQVIYGPEDGDGLLARCYLANILRKTGKDALPIYEEIYEIQSKHWPHKSFTLATRINIALELGDRGKYNESFKIFDELSNLHIQIKSDPSSVWFTLTNKCFVLCKQGNFREALYISKFLHENKKRVLGEGHPVTLENLRSTGIILADQGEYEKAESTMKTVISATQQDDKIEISQLKWFLALILKKHGKFDESLSLFNELYAMMKKNRNKTITLLTAKLLVKILDQQGKYDEALRLYKEVKEMDKFGSPDYLITVKNIKRITDQQGDSNKLGPSSNELYEIELKKFWEICEDCQKHVAEYK